MRERRFITKVREKVDAEFDQEQLWLITLIHRAAPTNMSVLHEDVAGFLRRLGDDCSAPLRYIAVPRSFYGLYDCHVLTDMPETGLLDVNADYAEKLWPHGAIWARTLPYYRVPELARYWAVDEVSREGMWMSRRKEDADISSV